MFYIIGGPPRSGKSLIRKELLYKENLSGIDTDSLRAMLQVDKNLNTQIKNAANMEKFLVGLIDEFINYKTEDYVLEGDIITIHLALKYLRSENRIKFIFIGYPDINIIEKFKIIRNTETEINWTRTISNQKLKDKISGWIKRSQTLQKECKKNNILFFNLSNTKNFFNEIKEIVYNIKNNG